MKIMAAALLLLTLEACGGRSVPLEMPPHRLSLQLERERKRLARTDNPVSQVKIQIRIADALLALARHSAAGGETAAMMANFTDYARTIESSYETLRESGRNARAKSEGFLDFELALRRQIRQLEDITLTLNVTEREQVERIIARASTIRAAILDALMGGGGNNASLP